VILQEIGQAADTPDDIIFDWLQEEAFPGQPLGRTILGPGRAGARLHPRRFRPFVAEHYGPNRMILSAAGAVDHDGDPAPGRGAFGHLKAARRGRPARFAGGEKARGQGRWNRRISRWRWRRRAIASDDFHTAQIYATGAGRRHVLAPVPGIRETARPVLHDLRQVGPSTIPAC
jgi:hypothetical protein